MTVRQAVFLVGGKGTRLGEATRTTPKPLLPIAPGLRFLDLPLEEAARHGFTDIILLAGHLGEQVEEAYQGVRIREAQIRVIREPEPQGTGGALRFAAGELAPWFLMSNGDSFFDINLRALATEPSDAFSARLALREVPDASRYGAVSLEGDAVTAFREKSASATGPALINGGVYLMSRDVLGRIKGPCSIEQDIFPPLAAEGRLRGAAFQGYFLDIGLPDTYAQAQAELPAQRQRPCVFLDRDGVLNVDKGYTHKPGDLVWNPGAREAIRLLNDSGRLVIVVSNQAGVGRGYYDEAAVDRFHAHMSDELARIGAHIDAFYWCPYHPEASVERYRVADHPDRKPNPGMIHRALAEWPIRPQASFLVGDQASDLAAAKATGLPAHLYEGGDLRALVAKLLDA